ncbi:cytoskeleton-associated protein 2-like isoform X2 [Choloepus didactylus]|nr:cytoskeleton-associated protein 2-like isoform X2 [Choloepus didactylus]XP_037656437.1 cytoskeleton-associated protein 2-like isoform X2 [Choloepus didactylus]XP_037656438.1 cytoskeleton-associated protein 2-like isoform X2 [Choloepus didactylus]
MMTSEHQVQEGTKVLKLKTNMADKENANRLTETENNITMGKNCNPLKPSNDLTNSTIVLDIHNLKDNNKTIQLLPVKDDPQSQRRTFSQGFHLKKNGKENQMTTEKPKHGVTNIPKKLVLGSYRGQIVQSKVNSFRKPVQVKDASAATTQKLSVTVSEATEPQPVNTSSVTVKSNSTSNRATTKFVSTARQDRQLVQPPIRSHHSSNQDKVKQDISRTSASVTVQKGPTGKGLLQLKTDLSRVKISSSQDTKRNETSSRNLGSEIITRPASSTNRKLIEKSKTIDQRRHTVAQATFVRSAQPKETAERRIRLTEWKTGRGRVLKRPSSSVLTQLEPEGQNENPVGSFWSTMAEEDEQRLFTEKINRTFSECLNLINEGCPPPKILATLNDLVKNIPGAKKLVKYWICLARLEPITSPIENIIMIYEKAILARAQPIEEMRRAVVDILTLKSQEEVSFGEKTKACAATEEIQEVNTDNIGVNLEPGKLEMEHKQPRSVIFQDCEEEQEDKAIEPISGAKTPSKETGGSCLIKYNVSTMPYLQSVKRKMQFNETNSTFKELKFLTPVRRSRRLQENNSKLPDMLKDHYPCVSSLEQLAELGSEMDAFVCRPNAALGRMCSEAETAEEK